MAWYEALTLEAHHSGDQGDQIGLHISRAATVDITVLLDQLERIAGPVLRVGGDHVHVGR